MGSSEFCIYSDDCCLLSISCLRLQSTVPGRGAARYTYSNLKEVEVTVRLLYPVYCTLH